jgi:hypothetical protein
MSDKSELEPLKVREWSAPFPKKTVSVASSSSSSRKLSPPPPTSPTLDFDKLTGAGAFQNALATSNALSFIIQLYRTCEGNFSSEERKKLVDTFSSKIIEMCSRTETELKETSLLKIDEFSCPICFGVVREPLTIRCGHSYCKKCLQKEVQGGQCKLCPFKFTHQDVMSTKPNVLCIQLTDKLWPDEEKVASLRNEGNQLCAAGKQMEAVEMYTQAIQLCKSP